MIHLLELLSRVMRVPVKASRAQIAAVAIVIFAILITLQLTIYRP